MKKKKVTPTAMSQNIIFKYYYYQNQKLFSRIKESSHCIYIRHEKFVKMLNKNYDNEFTYIRTVNPFLGR